MIKKVNKPVNRSPEIAASEYMVAVEYPNEYWKGSDAAHTHEGKLKAAAGRMVDASGCALRAGGTRDCQWQCETKKVAEALGAKFKALKLPGLKVEIVNARKWYNVGDVN